MKKERENITELTIAGETVQLVKIEGEPPLQRWITWQELKDLFWRRSNPGQLAQGRLIKDEDGNHQSPLDP